MQLILKITVLLFMRNTKIKGSTFMFRYLKTQFEKPLFLFVLIWVSLILCNWNCLYNPPYWDDVIGLHNQAIWYAKNYFNILKLWGQGNLAGNSNIYPLGIMPLIHALFYYSFAPEMAHLVGHLINMACLAITGALLYMMLSGKSSTIALLAVMVALSDPMIAGRSAALGQECPLLMLTFVSFYCFSKRRFKAALLFAILSFFIKFTGIILVLAYASFWLLRNGYYFYRRKRWSRQTRYLVVSLIAAIIMIVLMRHFGGVATSLVNLKRANRFIIFWYSYNITYFFFLEYIFAAIAVVAGILRYRSCSKANETTWLALIFISGFIVAFFLHSAAVTRYLSILTFPLIYIIFRTIPLRIGIVVALTMITFQLSTHNGLFFKKPHMERDGGLLERSREYIADLRGNQRLCRFLEEKAQERVIIAHWPFVQMLTMPEMGYVKKPLKRVYSASIFPKYCHLAHPLNDGTQFPYDTIFIYSRSAFDYTYSLMTLEPQRYLPYYIDENMAGLAVYMLPRRRLVEPRK